MSGMSWSRGGGENPGPESQRGKCKTSCKIVTLRTSSAAANSVITFWRNLSRSADVSVMLRNVTAVKIAIDSRARKTL